MCYMDLTRHKMDADILTDVCNVCSMDMSRSASRLADIVLVDSNPHA